VEPGGCTHTAVDCFRNDVCEDYTCNSILGCQYGPKDCEKEPRIAALLGNCYTAECNNSRNGCYLVQLDGTTVDTCGVCNGDGSTCFLSFDSNDQVAIAGGLLAAIIIGIVAVCAAIGVFGGKKGYDTWLKHKNNMQGASTNPLYDKGNMSGTNPLFDGSGTN